ncbi:MAG TPA: tol-pal system-associated acyl-CoA thioesterase [Sulfuricaulis sp.]|nr:tol-pal system-associated acyl-CoA thioesterase [Sulfuricaulis sp.]
MSKVFSIPIRIYYEDTDAGNVVYYANYLKFMERARTEWLRTLGLELDEIARRDGVIFAVRSARVDFIKPARFNDLLQATVELIKRGHASMTFAQQIQRESLTLCEGEVKVACLDTATLAPRAIPNHLVTQLDPGAST